MPVPLRASGLLSNLLRLPLLLMQLLVRVDPIQPVQKEVTAPASLDRVESTSRGPRRQRLLLGEGVTVMAVVADV